LATALARLRIVDVVEKEDVNEAMRLMEMSKDSLILGQEELKGRPQSITDKIYAVIREMALNAKTLKIADIKERFEILLCLNRNFISSPITIKETSQVSLKITKCHA